VIGKSNEVAPLLSVDGVVKDYRVRRQSEEHRLRAVDEVTFRCERAETVGIVGESGCGKTTVGRLVAGLIRPTAGTVVVRSVSDTGTSVPASTSAGVQMVYQSPLESLDRRMRIGSSVGEPLRHVARSARREAINRALADVGLTEEHARKYPHELSGGQQQRACIARALIASPSVVVLDEAVSNLDVLLQREVLALLLGLQADSGVAYIFISHDFATVAAVSTRVLVMYLGRVVEVLPAYELSQALLHPYSTALQSSQLRPRPDGTRAKPIILKGDPPSAIGRIQGCRFASRCPLADDRCRREEPPLTEYTANHLAACYYPGALVPEELDA
jgi:peptide/nickel transport system ATP-binding protein/oligopeptide transport system ATP-binding protein